MFLLFYRKKKINFLARIFQFAFLFSILFAFVVCDLFKTSFTHTSYCSFVHKRENTWMKNVYCLTNQPMTILNSIGNKVSLKSRTHFNMKKIFSDYVSKLVIRLVLKSTNFSESITFLVAGQEVFAFSASKKSNLMCAIA